MLDLLSLFVKMLFELKFVFLQVLNLQCDLGQKLKEFLRWGSF